MDVTFNISMRFRDDEVRDNGWLCVFVCSCICYMLSSKINSTSKARTYLASEDILAWLVLTNSRQFVGSDSGVKVEVRIRSRLDFGETLGLMGHVGHLVLR